MTELLYLTDPYLQEGEAVLLEVALEEGGRWKVICNQTIFYPIGGGQPTDQGEFLFADGEKAFVYQVLMKEGRPVHFLQSMREPKEGERVIQRLDWTRRFKHMRIHSAGHVIDFALHQMGYCPHPLYPLKGDHGKKPSILYQGILAGDIKEELEAAANELVKRNLRFTWSFKSLENLQEEAIYLQPGLPKNKPLRALHLEGVGSVADGGTIVSRTGEIGEISIKSIEQKQGTTQIYYQIKE
ncbi:alanine--tRNA ligase-related protein [Candidatus Protochlamydia phocaeensis]|uniref:alanine--tRNA ligase-related protein n=1 Tax=Candidatus Protochlamydia phocaeensis TaxID=1414722 RepID=UPI000838AEE7|nr:alanyl-tRNA editing protein [Candidatus Protochlamydia phocaeensis]